MWLLKIEQNEEERCKPNRIAGDFCISSIDGANLTSRRAVAVLLAIGRLNQERLVHREFLDSVWAPSKLCNENLGRANMPNI